MKIFKSKINKKLTLGLVILIILFAIGAIYLQKSYSNIYNYQQKLPLLLKPLETSYLLEGGVGQDQKKYLALGDSLTYGLGSNSKEGTFPFVVGRKLLKKHQKVEVINLGVPGAVVEDVWASQLPRALSEKPDYITLMIGTNDLHNFASLTEFKSKLGEIVDSLKSQTKAQITLINIPYLGTSKRIVPPYDSWMDRQIREFNQAIEEVALQRNIKYVDLYSLSKEAFKKNSDYYSLDEFHPSDKGYLFWGELIDAD